MNTIKKFAGIIWLLLAALTAYSLGKFGYEKWVSGWANNKQEDIVFSIILLGILVPIIVGGLVRFGLYAIQGEYND